MDDLDLDLLKPYHWSDLDPAHQPQGRIKSPLIRYKTPAGG